MLKIKDNVDLKQLEKFGFTRIVPYEPNKLKYDGKYLGGINMSINLRNRKIELNQYTGGIWRKIDLIYDLIKADVVEKVVEDESNND